MPRFVCRVEGVGNPDFQQYAPVAPSVTLHARTLRGIARRVGRYIDFWNLGGGNYSGGVVFRVRGARARPVAKVSYNLRLWPVAPWRPGLRPLSPSRIRRIEKPYHPSASR